MVEYDNRFCSVKGDILISPDTVEHLIGLYPVFSELSAEDRAQLIRKVRIRKFEKGSVLKSRKTALEEVCVVMDGYLRITTSEKNSQFLLFYIPKDDCCLLTAPRLCQSQALKYEISCPVDTVLLTIDDDAFLQLEETYPQIRNAVDNRLARQLEELIFFLDVKVRSSQLDQLYYYLKYLARVFKTDELRITHELIGQDMLIRREIVSRLLTELRSLGRIDMSRNRIIVKDFS